MLNRKNFHVIIRILFLALIISMSGCLQTYYTPNMHQVPLFKQKGEAAFTVAISGGEQVSSGEILGAYALSDHVGLLVNASRGAGKMSDTYLLSAYDSVNQRGTRRHLVEIGGGYFDSFGGKGVFEIYGGVGLGSVYNYYDTRRQSYSNVKFNRFFIQPGIGKKGEYFDFAFSFRLATLHYNSIRPHNLGEAASLDANALQLLDRNRFYLLSEPAFTIRGGFKAIKLQIQMGYSFV